MTYEENTFQLEQPGKQSKIVLRELQYSQPRIIPIASLEDIDSLDYEIRG